MKTPKRNDSKHFNKRGPKPYFAKDPLRCDTVLRTGMQCDFEARSESKVHFIVNWVNGSKQEKPYTLILISFRQHFNINGEVSISAQILSGHLGAKYFENQCVN